MSCLHIRDLSVRFPSPRGAVKAVDGVSLDHREQETLALIGETGCGKTTLAKAILRLTPEDATVRGRVEFMGRDLLGLTERELAEIRGKEIGIVFQNPALALNPVHKIGKQVAEPLRVHEGIGSREAAVRAVDSLERLGLQDVEEQTRKYPFQLSGGMNQRVVIAASMILSPKLLIADEPTKGLDQKNRQSVVEELRLIKRRSNSSILLITHDLRLAKRVADRIAIMYAGMIVEVSPTEAFFREQLHPYSRALMKSLPDEGFQPIPGAPPAMTSVPSGCRFHPRCAERREVCDKETPEDLHRGDRTVKCVLYAES
jgi:peptide/nickel transport system ATP-binding protein